MDKFVSTLCDDSKICAIFVKKVLVDDNAHVDISPSLFTFVNKYIDVYTTIYNNINNKLSNPNQIDITLNSPNIQIDEKYEYVSISKSNDPHVISYAKKSQENASNFINKTGIFYTDDIETISEKISISDTNVVSDFYNKAKNNYSEIKHDNIYQYFCPVTVQHNIEQHMNYKKYYKVIYGNYKVFMTYLTAQQELSKKFKLGIVIPLISICIISNKNNAQIEYVVYTTNEKKNLPKIKFLGSHSINTGSTYRGNCQTIKLWRKEEVKKVACHELFHCLSLDFHTMPDVHLSILKNKLNVSNDINILLGESYTEMWATIINCLNTLMNFFNNDNKNVSGTTHMDVFKMCIKYEIYFSLFQTAKILNFFNYKNYDDFYNVNGIDVSKKNGMFKQNTCVMSYYIVKSALLFSLNDFMDYCSKYNDKENIMQFIENDYNYKEYMMLIIKSMKNTQFINEVNRMMKIIQNLIENNHTNKFIYNTLRMTCLEV
jgi:hypothetical protein